MYDVVSDVEILNLEEKSEFCEFLSLVAVKLKVSNG